MPAGPSSSTTASADYAFKPGGSLKFKDGGVPGGSKKKRKKTKSSTTERVHDQLSRRDEGETSALIEDRAGTSRRMITNGEGDGNDDAEASAPIKRGDDDDDDEMGQEHFQRTGRSMTKAERKFEETRRKRMAERVLKQAKLSHKDRVDAFNRDLESRTEHFDMPRVGGGG